MISNLAVGYFAVSKKSALFKCASKSVDFLPPAVVGSTEALSVTIELTSMVKDPPVIALFSAESVPSLFKTPYLGFKPPLW
ncbi:hypothetical protein D3C72_2099480 [compost metagenome]